MKNYDVVALGIAVMDIVAAPVDKNLFEHNKTPVDSVILAPGGDAANQAAHLARLGWRTTLCCRLGEDALSRQRTRDGGRLPWCGRPFRGAGALARTLSQWWSCAGGGARTTGLTPAACLTSRHGYCMTL